MKVLSWLGLMLCIVTLAFMALTLASASVITSVKVIASEVDESLVRGAIDELREGHPMLSALREGESGKLNSDRGAKTWRVSEPEVHIAIERSPEGCTIFDSVAWDIPMHRRVRHLLLGEPSLKHLTPVMVGEALQNHWSSPERTCVLLNPGSIDAENKDDQDSGETSVFACDSSWAWAGLTSLDEAKALQGFLSRKGWALPDSSTLSWTILADSDSSKSTGGTREDVTTFTLYRPY